MERPLGLCRRPEAGKRGRNRLVRERKGSGVCEKGEAVKKSDRYGDDDEIMKHVLFEFDSQVGVRAEDEQKLVVTLKRAKLPFLASFVAFYPLFPVNRRCVETHGVPDWTKP